MCVFVCYVNLSKCLWFLPNCWLFPCLDLCVCVCVSVWVSEIDVCEHRITEIFERKTVAIPSDGGGGGGGEGHFTNWRLRLSDNGRLRDGERESAREGKCMVFGFLVLDIYKGGLLHFLFSW